MQSSACIGFHDVTGNKITFRLKNILASSTVSYFKSDARQCSQQNVTQLSTVKMYHEAVR
jgi:hypothetical protein